MLVFRGETSFECIWVFSENGGFSPQIIHFNRDFHEINHPFCGTNFRKHPYRGSNPTLSYVGMIIISSYYIRIPIKQPVWSKVRFFFFRGSFVSQIFPFFSSLLRTRDTVNSCRNGARQSSCIPRLKSEISYRYFRRQEFTSAVYPIYYIPEN